MNNYLVSARKYRPKKFEDVIGQKHITTTLHNAILNNKIAHAYLFCGPRGVGKTTCARIFAKSINTNTNEQYNIFELDAASNNGVDHIRHLIEQVKIPPQVGQYKVYIIDEVHMLSDAAFNAFLKTLEEPPKHSIFILATTEKNKLIPTILSRCQIFDFQKITANDITKYLLAITKKEGIHVEQKTIELIAEKADGALRDALSTFDKIHAYCNENWNHQQVLKILSSLDISFSIQLTNDIIKNDISGCLLKINDVVDTGIQTKEIINVLITHFRNLMIAKDTKTLPLINENQEIQIILANQAKSYSKEEIIIGLNYLNECDKHYKNSINKRFLVELCIMELCGLTNANRPIGKKKTMIPTPTKKATETQLEKQKNISSEQAESEVEKQKNTNSEQHKSINHNTLISITEELEQKNEENSSRTDKRDNNWNEEDLLKAWKNFAEKLKRQQQTNLYNIFSRYLPKKSDNTILIKIVNLSQKAAIKEIQAEFLIFAKNELANDFINLIIEISQSHKTKNMLHTKQEKYKHIVEKNKNIQLLQEKLDLSIT